MSPALVRLVLALFRWPLIGMFRFGLSDGLGCVPVLAIGKAKEVRPFVLHRWFRPFLLRFFLSPQTREPYMMRICITPFHGTRAGRVWTWLRLPEVFVHYFYRSDEDRELHNHPFRWAVSLILAGGYLETRDAGWKVVKTGETNTILESTFHRVTLLDEQAGCWSLFVCRRAPAGDAWGFLQDDGSIVPHLEYHARRAHSLNPEA